jgi:electron transfer flavoprotein beta subunit
MRGIMSARTKSLQVVEAVEIAEVAKVVKFETPAPRGAVKQVPAEEAAKLIDLLHTEAKVI